MANTWTGKKIKTTFRLLLVQRIAIMICKTREDYHFQRSPMQSYRRIATVSLSIANISASDKMRKFQITFGIAVEREREREEDEEEKSCKIANDSFWYLFSGLSLPKANFAKKGKTNLTKISPQKFAAKARSPQFVFLSGLAQKRSWICWQGRV